MAMQRVLIRCSGRVTSSARAAQPCTTAAAVQRHTRRRLHSAPGKEAVTTSNTTAWQREDELRPESGRNAWTAAQQDKPGLHRDPDSNKPWLMPLTSDVFLDKAEEYEAQRRREALEAAERNTGKTGEHAGKITLNERDGVSSAAPRLFNDPESWWERAPDKVPPPDLLYPGTDRYLTDSDTDADMIRRYNTGQNPNAGGYKSSDVQDAEILAHEREEHAEMEKVPGRALNPEAVDDSYHVLRME